MVKTPKRKTAIELKSFGLFDDTIKKLPEPGKNYVSKLLTAS